MVRIEAKYPKWMDALSRWSAYSNEPLMEVLQDETRGVIERATKFTPPQRGQNQGKKAVAEDIRKLFKTENNFKTGVFRNNGKRSVGGRFNSILRGDTGWAGSPQKASRALNAIGKNIGLPHIRIAGSNRIYKEHEANRTRKNRRTRSRGGKEIVVVPEAELSQYIERRQKKVGLHKGGWAVAGQKLGMNFQDFVSRNAKYGRYKEYRQKNVIGCLVGNSAAGMVEHDRANKILSNAVEARTRDIEKRLSMAIKGTLDSMQTPGKRFTGRMVGASKR